MQLEMNKILLIKSEKLQNPMSLSIWKLFMLKNVSLMLSGGSRNNDDNYILTQNKEKLSEEMDYDLRSAEFLILRSVWTQARAAWQECGNKRCTSERLDEVAMHSLLTCDPEAGHGLQRGFVCPSWVL